MDGMYVETGPMDLAKAAAHLYFHLRDLERGFTYDHECRRVPMSWSLFEARSKYLAEICRKQGGKECGEIEELVEEVLRHRALPRWAEELAMRKIIRISQLI
ncbi:MAG: hypothetical protein ACP5I3_01200 [Thermoproteus sp.]|jgi:hypothetical protein